MQLKSLKVFCDIIRLGSFSKAAELNGVSQPSASQLVHHLEERLGVQLIDRSKRPFVVTPEGKLYHDGCRDVVRRYEELEDLVRQCHESPAGRLRVAAIYSVGLGQMHRVVEEFRDERSGVDLHVEYMHPDQVRAAVLAGEADLGVTSYPEAGKQLSITPWRDEPFAVAVDPRHPLASEMAVSADALSGQRMVMPQPGLRVRDEVDRWLASHKVDAEEAVVFDNLESVKRAIEVGEGIGLLPAPTFATETLAGTLVRVNLIDTAGEPEQFVRPLGVLHRRGEDLSAAAEHFMKLLKRHADDPPERPPMVVASETKSTAV
ncbi:MAG: LysR family transcriptional regulator [Planctomycetota bacterium]